MYVFTDHEHELPRNHLKKSFSVLQIRRGNRDNLDIIFLISLLKHIL